MDRKTSLYLPDDGDDKDEGEGHNVADDSTVTPDLGCVGPALLKLLNLFLQLFHLQGRGVNQPIRARHLGHVTAGH